MNEDFGNPFDLQQLIGHIFAETVQFKVAAFGRDRQIDNRKHRSIDLSHKRVIGKIGGQVRLINRLLDIADDTLTVTRFRVDLQIDAS
ncbi:hypothetical protein BMS3Bbin11_01322 [bacterium BMS3Bbin11]|nr:hypothetical protein BMS3Bbin11_01322 [bacterium BMS3Bbin11]